MPAFPRRTLVVVAVCAAAALLLPSVPPIVPAARAAGPYYVAPGGDDAWPGTLSQPWATLQKAADVLAPGETVYVRGGTYAASFRPARSGAPGSYITYEAYQGETPVINLTQLDGRPALDLGSRQYLKIAGLTVDANQSGTWIEGWSGTSYNVVQNCTFRNGSPNGHGVGLMYATHNTFLGNRFEQHGVFGTGGSDAMKLHVGCDFNLIEGNTFINSEHALLNIQGSHNVIRRNYLENAWEKNSETNGDVAPEHNLWEYNTFATTHLAGDQEDSPGIQFSGPRNIVRFNVFYANQGGGLRPEAYGAGTGGSFAPYVNDNRVYNNVFWNNSHAGIYLCWYEPDGDLTGNLFKNNVLTGNIQHESSATPNQIYFQEFQGNGLGGNCFINNDIHYTSEGAMVIGHDALGQNSLGWWQDNYPESFAGNLDLDPGFVDPPGYRFELREDSPLIDRGDFLARTSGSGDGREVAVDDARWFCDGMGVIDGDQVVVGDNEPARVTGIDYAGNRITLDRDIHWGDGDPVSLPFGGNGPDMGAVESSYSAATGDTATPTRTPTPTKTPRRR